jgi:RND superfamily putative drug exporter
MRHRNIAAAAGRWSARHRRVAILGWILFVVAASVIGGSVGQKMIAEEDFGNGESRRADQIIAGADFKESMSESVLVQDPAGRLKPGDAAFDAAVKDVEARLARVPHVEELSSPLAEGNEGQISKDGRSALISFDIRADDEQVDRVDPALAATAAAQAAHPELRIEQFGDGSADKALSQAFEDDFQRAELFSLPITLVILLLAFGALIAAILPLALGATAVAATIGILAPISQLVPVDEAIGSVILLIGLAVGVDYSMFYLRREREERANGRSAEAALAAAAATSGRAVLISGFTVMVAMAGMLLSGSAIFESFAVGTILVVAVAMVGSITVLPALLSALGDKASARTLPWLLRLVGLRGAADRADAFSARIRHGGQSRVWDAILSRVLRRPVIAAVLSAGLLVALAIPALGLRTANPGIEGLPKDLPIMQTYERIQAAFPGGQIPAVVAIRDADVTRSEIQKAITDLEREALATGQMSEPVTTSVNPDQTVALVLIPLAGDGTDDASDAALMALREDVIPTTIGRVADDVAVTGLTAGSKDFNEAMVARLPLVFGFVLSMAFLLLLVTFRSIVVPLKAIVLNLLSVAAAYGVLKLVFQDGHGEDLLGFESFGGVTSWLPLFLFVILFGLSMDYHVFILSRVREAVDRGMTTSDAVAHGIKSTAGVVTSAAVVMIAVFSIFATLSAVEFKQMGVGLAVAILIDATIVRAVLLPATMKLLGEWNWYLPRRLQWLPHFEHEPLAPPTAPARTAEPEMAHA